VTSPGSSRPTVPGWYQQLDRYTFSHWYRFGPSSTGSTTLVSACGIPLRPTREADDDAIRCHRCEVIAKNGDAPLRVFYACPRCDAKASVEMPADDVVAYGLDRFDEVALVLGDRLLVAWPAGCDMCRELCGAGAVMKTARREVVRWLAGRPLGEIDLSKFTQEEMGTLRWGAR
jgi:hypothetical protein